MSPRMRTVDLRELIRDALVVEDIAYGEPPPQHQFYLPKAHARALHINIPVVLGDRGMGKSYWWAALQSPIHRSLLARNAPDIRIGEETVVFPGFGNTSDLQKYPTKDVFAHLLGAGQKSRLIWKAVVVWSAGSYAAKNGLATVDAVLPAVDSWVERVAWLAGHLELAERLLQQFDAALSSRQQDCIWVFDAMDAAADDAATFYTLVEGLCQVALELRSFRHLRAKVFLRTDQFADRRVSRFPDVTKLRASTASLNWLKTELFGLLWHLLGNYPLRGAEYRRDLATTLFEYKFRGWDLGRVEEIVGREEVAPDWTVPQEARFDTAVQERIFHRLTGPYMGESARKGFPYSWLPIYLADAGNNISPRSFLSALAKAVVDTMDHHADHRYPIHFRSLHVSVHEASRIRVAEIAEHPWVRPLMEALSGHVGVPFEVADAEDRWDEANVFADSHVVAAEIGAPESARQRLAALGVWREMKTGRIDVPDIYRLGFGLARRGEFPLLIASAS